MSDLNRQLYCYLFANSHSVCELWHKRDESDGISVYEALRFIGVSGVDTTRSRTEKIADVTALEQWMADHSEMFTTGRVSRN